MNHMHVVRCYKLIMITIGRILKAGLSQLSKLNRFIEPINLSVNEAPEMPKLKLKSEKHLL